MPKKCFSLVLVRHGQTEQNTLRIIQGQMQSQLTDTGREQAELLGEFFVRNENFFDKVYSSDLARAYDTCLIALRGRKDIIKDKLLRERSFGVLEGLPIEKMRQEAGKSGFDAATYAKFKPEGGETMDDVKKRILEFCHQELFPKSVDGSSILILTHGGVIREFMKYFKEEGCRLENRDIFITPNTGINSFQVKVKEDGSLDTVCVRYLHETPHLLYPHIFSEKKQQKPESKQAP